MTDTSPVTFLEQAHRNNWEHYLASLQGHGRTGWDVCLLTASDARQAAMYRRQLDWRREAGLLPPRTEFVVLPDPDGRRIGSGGATLNALLALTPAPAPKIGSGERVLIIHSGGDSRRLPHCSAIGKLFARVPRTLPDGRASTIFDEFLISLSGLAVELPSGVLLASGDVLLVFDHLQLSFQRGGVIGVAAAAPAEMGTHHGVYVSGDGGYRVAAYLHKPSTGELTRWGALAPDGTVHIDTGLVWLDRPTVETLAALAGDERITAPALNLYGDLLLPLAGSTTLDGYLADVSDGPATPAVQVARRVIWERLRGTPFTVERLQPAVFVHFGTSQEYWRMAAGDPGLARMCGWDAEGEEQGGGGTGERVLVNAAVNPLPAPPPARGREVALVADSLLEGPFSWQGAALVAAVQTARSLALGADVVVHQLPVAGGGYVTRVFGLHDDPKQLWQDEAATFMNQPWAAWLAAAGVAAESLWPDVAPAQRTLWNARLFPLAVGREESLALALPLQDPAHAPADWRSRWVAAERLSLADGFSRADGERILAELAAVEDQAAARRFCAAVAAEQPASQAKTLLGRSPTPPSPLPAREGGAPLSPGRGGAGREVKLARRVALVADWLVAADPLLQLRGYKALTEATGDATWEDRAFATLAAIIEGSTLKVQGSSVHPSSFILHPSALKHSCRVEAAARIDFGGGWTDTPPYSIERGGTVLNAALTLHGRYPVIAEAKWLPQPRLILESRDIDAAVTPACAGELLAYANSADPFALPKAALVLRGFVPEGTPPETPVSDLARRWGGGLRLSTATNIPRGSGLGTSSIMAGAVLACLSALLAGSFDFTPHPSTTATCFDCAALRSADVASAQEALRSAQDASSANADRASFTLHPSSFIPHPSSLIPHPSSLFAEVLCLEQMLTTGGGWQDQVGGLTGGIKLVTTGPGLPQRIQVAPVALAPATAAGLTERLVMVYTGQQRLAKNLLRAVMGRWMARDPEMVWLQGEIARLALAMRAALSAGDLDNFGALLSEHWALNKRMDPGCTNPFIDGLFATLTPYLAGGKLAGAGGGGFVMAIARDGQAARDLPAALAAQYPGTPVAVWPAAVPAEGLCVEG